MKALFIQAIKFFGISGIGWCLDMLTYLTLCHYSTHVGFANLISCWVGVTFAFIFSTRFLFTANNNISLKCKYLLYLLYQVILILGLSVFIVYVNEFVNYYVYQYTEVISKILVTPVAMVSNFVVMKLLIEKV